MMCSSEWLWSVTPGCWARRRWGPRVSSRWTARCSTPRSSSVTTSKRRPWRRRFTEPAKVGRQLREEIVDSSQLWLRKQNVRISSITPTHFNMMVKSSGHGLAFVTQRCSAKNSDLCKIPIWHGPTWRYSERQRYEGLFSSCWSILN